VSTLLDANVLIALGFDDHIHHAAVADWLSGLEGSFATCPITQGALLRAGLRSGATAADALRLLGSLEENPSHEFWPDDLGFERVDMAGVVGHRQVTDAYLAALARHHGGTLATIDAGLAALQPDVTVVVPR